MDDAAYLNDSYLKELDAEVINVKDDKFVVLDKTIFYPNSGGQPNDTGKMLHDDKEYLVTFVGKFDGKISHETDKPGLKIGDKVRCVINWERRHKLMRSHTASHVLSAVFEKNCGTKITGNQLGIDKCRMDYNTEEFDKDKINKYIAEANDIIKKDLPITVSYMAREEVLKDSSLVKLANAFPPNIDILRIVQIGNVDKQADGGTHLKSTKEVGQIIFLKAENKGANNRRIYFEVQ